MPNSKTSEASHVSKARRVTLKKYKILNGDKTQEKTQNSRKNSKLKPKTQEFGIFASPTCRKNGQKTSLCYVFGSPLFEEWN